MPVEVRGAADFVSKPWRNGLGQTTELAREGGEDEFVWRISRAAVTQDGPFSAFPHIDRILVLLSGAGLIFDFGGGGVVKLSEHLNSMAFAGDVPVHCTLVDGPCQDLNIMVDRRWGSAQIFWHHDDGQAVCAAASVFCALDGRWRVNGQALEPGGVAVARDEESVSVRQDGGGTLLQVNFTPRT